MAQHYFDTWTEEEVSRYKEVFGDNLEQEDEEVLVLNQPDAYEEVIRFLKKDDEVYVETEEDEQFFEKREEDGAIYMYDRIWWYKVDMDAILKDYADGVEIDTNEYRL